MKTNFIKETSGSLSKSRGRDYIVEDPRRVPKLLLKIMIATTANKQST